MSTKTMYIPLENDAVGKMALIDLMQGCHEPSICKKCNLSVKCNKVKHKKMRYACIHKMINN